MAAMPAVLNQVKRKQVKLTLGELKAGLSSYKLDNGSYPINEVDEEEGAFVLYKHLSGDFDQSGELDDEATGTKIYVAGIDWNTAKNQAQQRVEHTKERHRHQ